MNKKVIGIYVMRKVGTHQRKAGCMGEGHGGGKHTKRTYRYGTVIRKPIGLYDNLQS